MSQGPRSQPLIVVASTAAGYPGGFVCPTGYVTLVKHAVVTNTTTAGVRVVMLGVRQTPPVTVNIFDQSIAANQTLVWPGTVSLAPADYVQVYAAAAGVHFWVSGALLFGAPAAPAGTTLEEHGIVSPTSAPAGG